MLCRQKITPKILAGPAGFRDGVTGKVSAKALAELVVPIKSTQYWSEWRNCLTWPEVLNSQYQRTRVSHSQNLFLLSSEIGKGSLGNNKEVEKEYVDMELAYLPPRKQCRLCH